MKAKTTTILMSPAGEAVTLRPGDEVPSWANITNPEVAEKATPAPKKTGKRAAQDTE